MVLSREQIERAGVVVGAVPESKRSTTYDATIGEIISEGVFIEAKSFTLEKRGIVWVVSNEEFNFEPTKTGLATLKTTWTHKGVLALNVGVIDPGWYGPLATALVNFSASKITITKGDPFFRVMVFSNANTACKRVRKEKLAYLDEIREKSRLFSTTFLDMHSLVDEVAQSVFKLPKLAVGIGFAGLMVALAAIFAPIAFDVWKDKRAAVMKVEALEQRVEKLEGK